MIKLSKLTDYGVVLMTALAQNRGVGPMAARDLSEELGLPLPTVSKLLKHLARAGLLESQRGVKGGYALARAPEDIDLSEILVALEGPLSMTACVEGECRHIEHCGASIGWHEINQRFLDALRNVTLAHMGESPLSSPSRRIEPTASIESRGR